MGKTKIILTGANGFLGKNLHNYLINHEYDVMTISVRDHNLNEVKSDIINYQPDIFLGLRVVHILMLIPTVIMVYYTIKD